MTGGGVGQVKLLGLQCCVRPYRNVTWNIISDSNLYIKSDFVEVHPIFCK
jgi:hypothetical protein